MGEIINSQERLELLITAFIVSELYSDKFSHMLQFSEVSEKDKEKLEQKLVDKLVENAMEEINKYFTEKELPAIVLSGQSSAITIYNIVKFPKGNDAKVFNESNPFTSITCYELEDFIN